MATWNPNDKGPSVTLSNGNLTAVIPNSANSARGTLGVRSGKVFWEYTVDVGGWLMLGVADADVPINASNYTNAHTRYLYANGGFYPSGGANSPGSFTTGDVIGIALDMDNGTLTFYKNGVTTGVSWSNLKSIDGAIYPMITSGASSSGGTVTVNFGATAFKYSIPAGYQSYNSLEIPVTGVSLDQTTLSLNKGGTATLTATITPSDAFDKMLTWKTSDPWVAQVANGVVKGVGVGSCTISATSTNGIKATCEVTVAAANYITINNAKVYFNNIYYVDAVNGDDSSGTGASALPYKTVQKAITVAANGDLIFAREGIYDVTNGDVLDDTYGYRTGLGNDSKNVDFMGVPGKTIFKIDGTTHGKQDCHMYSGQGWSNLYHIVFDCNLNNRTASYATAIFGYGPVNGRFYNCVFKQVSSLGATPGLLYSQTNTVSYIECHNCAFNLNVAMSNSYGYYGVSLLTKVVNSVINSSFISDGNFYDCNLADIKFDSDYRILNKPWKRLGQGLNTDGNQAHLGVYGGPYSWDYYPKTRSLLKQEDKIMTITETTLIDTGLSEPLTVEQFEVWGIADFEILTNYQTEYRTHKNSEADLGAGKLLSFQFNLNNLPLLTGIEVDD